jgi:predicted N-formylglutamate amidohydrolase
MTDDPPFEMIAADARPDMLLVCDHATNRVPPSVEGGDLGLPPAEMARHIAYDIGVRGVTQELSRLLGAPAILSRFSRLVIDPNRGEDDPTLVMRLYDGTIIPGNRAIDTAGKARRLSEFHRPYHAAITAILDARRTAGYDPALVAIHSFTPRLNGREPRPWHVAVLWRHDDRLAGPLLARLRAEPDLCVGENQPYDGQLEGDTLSRHGTRRGLRHVLIELRQDLIAEPDGQRAWAARLAPMLAEVIAETRNPTGERTDG